MRLFGQLEAAIMDTLWRAERPLAVREVRESMNYERDVAYSTVMTVATILHHKGLLEREMDGRVWLYWPRHSRAEHTALVMSEVFSSCGDRRSCLRRFIETVSEHDIALLSEEIARRQRSMSRSQPDQHPMAAKREPIRP
ncbi:BlaI/MecI/CopY family transcriptional regulator [Streptomonospora sp. PA3]|uniref:BlaI/MecI/CopY family transcriptional regulator n=1 Tax=Streptomonospora sp. PA3 TaxID=2607326 RepID=UPI0012DECB5B|nr:BlaI/MecI/CopY family transcriptional regulator [Streptomonospora sp. PA3]MUL41577.1 BlaI/MecI/CopY family transcriptional regulator [Streptomonospora sp. PA3]